MTAIAGFRLQLNTLLAQYSYAAVFVATNYGKYARKIIGTGSVQEVPKSID